MQKLLTCGCNNSELRLQRPSALLEKEHLKRAECTRKKRWHLKVDRERLMFLRSPENEFQPPSCRAGVGERSTPVRGQIDTGYSPVRHELFSLQVSPYYEKR